MENKYVFLDVDDTLLTPPHRSVSVISKFLFMKNFPSEEEMRNRSHIDYYKAFPETLKSKNTMWLMALSSLPFGLHRSQKLFQELNTPEFFNVLKDERVILLSKNPPIFSRWRIKRLKELLGVDFENRYVACGPMFSKSISKCEIIDSYAKLFNIDKKNCLLIDDNVNEIDSARKKGFSTLLLSTPWNREYSKERQIKRSDICNEISCFLGKIKHPDKKFNYLFIAPSYGYFGRITIFFKIIIHKLKISPTKKVNITTCEFGSSTFRGLTRKSRMYEYLKRHEKNMSDIKLLINNPLGFTTSVNLSSYDYLNKEINFEKKVGFLKRLILDYYSHFNIDSGSPFFEIEHIGKTELVRFVKENVIRELGENYNHEKVMSYVREMTSSRSAFGNYLVHLYSKILCKFLFKNIHVNIPNDLRSIEKDYFVIFTPSHRSIFDSTLLMKIYCDYSCGVPVASAALKMKQNIVGIVGKIVGAYFIRRKKVDDTYTAVLNSVIKHSLINSRTTNIYLEGQRSRQGYTLRPKVGALKSYLLNAQQLKNIKICIQPISLVYDILPESESLLKDMHQENLESIGTDIQEKTDMLIKTYTKKNKFSIFLSTVWKLLLGKEKSSVHVNFSDPIYIDKVDDYFDINNGFSVNKELLQDTVNETMSRINNSAAPLISSIACLALLSSKEKHLYINDIKHFINFSSVLLKLYGCENDTRIFKNHTGNITEQLNSVPFINRKFKLNNVKIPEVISLVDVDILRAKHYRNNIIHYYILPAFIAKIIQFNKKGQISDLEGIFNKNFDEVVKTYYIRISMERQIFLEKILKYFQLTGDISISNNNYSFIEKSGDNPFSILLELAGVLELQLKNKIFFGYKRKNERFKANCKIHISFKNTKKNGSYFLENISLNGGKILTEFKFGIGEQIKVMPYLENQNEYLNAIIIRSEDDGFVFEFLDDLEANDVKRKIMYKILSL
ncbi:MAG: PilZ domain-containing protein [Halobacteriovoraceae bacterium]|nr:PilZ domain-containing protein [Halobacteriovoraceae bacterium]